MNVWITSDDDLSYENRTALYGANEFFTHRAADGCFNFSLRAVHREQGATCFYGRRSLCNVFRGAVHASCLFTCTFAASRWPVVVKRWNGRHYGPTHAPLWYWAKGSGGSFIDFAPASTKRSAGVSIFTVGRLRRDIRLLDETFSVTQESLRTYQSFQLTELLLFSTGRGATLLGDVSID